MEDPAVYRQTAEGNIQTARLFKTAKELGKLFSSCLSGAILIGDQENTMRVGF